MSRTRLARLTSLTTAGALSGVAVLHLAWGAGSTFPFASAEELADAVVGRTTGAVPPPAACVAVAGLLAGAAGLVTGVPGVPRPVRRLGLVTVVGVLGVRGVVGLAGRTDSVSPGSSSERFRRLDRRWFSPLCLALAAGSATALVSS